MKTLKFSLTGASVLVAGLLLISTGCSKEEKEAQSSADKKILCSFQDVSANNYSPQLGDALFGAWTYPGDNPGTMDGYVDCNYPATPYDPNCCSPVTVYLTPSGYSHGIDVFESWGPGDGNLVNGVCTAAKQQALMDRVVAHANSINVACQGGQLNPSSYTFSYSVLLNGSGAIGVEVQVHLMPTCYSFFP